MISSEKIRYMTAVALLTEKSRNHEQEICRYRRKDYIAIHMFASWIAGSLAYLLMTAVLLIFMFGMDPDRYIALDTVGQIALLWGGVYLLLCLVFEWITWLCYSVRYAKAKSWQIRYKWAVRSLEEYYERSKDSYSEEDWQIKAEEGSRKNL